MEVLVMIRDHRFGAAWRREAITTTVTIPENRDFVDVDDNKSYGQCKVY